MGNIISFCLSCYGVLSHCWDSINTARAAYLGLEGALISNPSPSWTSRFNDDLIAEILSRLPVKSLVRFRCVCKSWLALISDPNFAGKNTGRLKLLETVNPTRSIDFEAILKEEYRLEYTVLPKAPKLWVLGSCYGLICREEEKGGDLILWNPSTRDTYKLPKFEKKLTCFYGFGYDSINEDYKVIVGLETQITIFTSKTGAWKTVQLPENVRGFDGEGCFVNGALHWLNYSMSNLKIISFDLAEEKLQELPPPNIRREEVCSQPQIGKTIGNCLFLYLYDDKRHRHQEGIAITIWVMYEYGENGSWTRVVQIPSSSLPKPHIFYYTPITVLEDGQVLINRIGKRSKWEQFVLYDPKENHGKKCRRHVRDYFEMPKFYLETLVLPPKTR